MSHDYTPGDWLVDSDAPDEDKREYLRIVNGARQPRRRIYAVRGRYSARRHGFWRRVLDRIDPTTWLIAGCAIGLLALEVAARWGWL